ncbi:unnamed protein product [Darwinula stevensoni]|uniref:3-hydroxy-3-methylglutaryl coenzyme A reductase n=1 Tax=Darwinula stevensoni TaxID=69355 RepID=A0A7R8X194_9CRUS|nr:unnamed protein product [Darwinula stevensoni]CAG0882035.1 unnamed protein product [Darwinula stevensoni]
MGLHAAFRRHGEICSQHPWEVIMVLVTATLSMMFAAESEQNARFPETALEYAGADAVIMTAIRCVAVLYSYQQYRTIQKSGSKYLLGIAGVFTIFSSFMFSTTVIKMGGGHFSSLKDAVFIFLLLMDLTKVNLLAQYVLMSETPSQVKKHISSGMATLGPAVTLDTLVEALVISVGTLSGIGRLRSLCLYSVLAVITRSLVLLTFYPALLSLFLELTQYQETPKGQELTKVLQTFGGDEGNRKGNPVLQRVKIIMSAGIIAVHLHRRMILSDDSDVIFSDLKLQLLHDVHPQPIHPVFRWFNANADSLMLLVILLTLIGKFLLEKRNFSPSEISAVFLPPPVRDERRTRVTFKIGDDFPEDAATQTEDVNDDSPKETLCVQCTRRQESIKKFSSSCLLGVNSQHSLPGGEEVMSDGEVLSLLEKQKLSTYRLESILGDPARAVAIRRLFLSRQIKAIANLPYLDMDYTLVAGACCENVVGYCQIPMGLAGPLLLNGKTHMVPMATTEGCLVASTNRGCRALFLGGGASCFIVGDGMTRGPVLRFPSAALAVDAQRWLENKENFEMLKECFDETSRFARLNRLLIRVAGRLLFVRFHASTGDAMGMNMLSKGTEIALKRMLDAFPQMEILGLSGNFCSDKKPAAINWIEGRGKSVVCEARIPGNVVKDVLKTTPQFLKDLNISKNFIGSAMAGSLGGFNAHAANIVSSIFIATGQDPAQVVTSGSCLTQMEVSGNDLIASVTLPSLEVGTVGGGTILPSQRAALGIMGIPLGSERSEEDMEGSSSGLLGMVIAGTVLAGELSLMAALSVGHLVQSHLKHNR